MLTSEEKNIISLIATDLASGRDLLRLKSDWKKVLKNCGDNIKKEDYDKMLKEIDEATRNFSWFDLLDKSSDREKEILLHFKTHQDYGFYKGVKNVYENMQN